MVFAIVAAFLAYRKATENGRNGWLWALAAAGVYIATQVVVSMIIGTLLGFGVVLFGWSQETFEKSTFTLPVTIVTIGASITATWLLLCYIAKPVTEEPPVDLPPPPPTFGQNN